MKHFSLFVLLFVAVVSTCAQVTGTVLDEKGSPLVGVAVTSPQTGAVAISDFNGKFLLDVPVGSPLELAFHGYRSVNVNAAEDMQVVLVRKGARLASNDSTGWKCFILVNGMTAFPFSPAVGLTVGMVKKGGWYLNVMSGFKYVTFSPNDVLRGGHYYYGDYPFYEGTHVSQTLSVTAGGVAKLGKAPLYLYAGTGYAYKSVLYRTNSDAWVAFATDRRNNWSPLHSLALETGLLVNARGFAMTVGYELMVGFRKKSSCSHELKIGFGGMFNCKKGTKK